jgi:hypothetical protein
MTPRPHRRRSSKENQARRYNLSQVAVSHPLMLPVDCLTQTTYACMSSHQWLVFRLWLPITLSRRRSNRPLTTVSFPVPCWRCAYMASCNVWL